MTAVKTRQKPYCRWFVELANAAAAAPASMPARFVDFCPGKKSLIFNILCGSRVDFCVHGQKGVPRKINALAANSVYFCVLL